MQLTGIRIRTLAICMVLLLAACKTDQQGELPTASASTAVAQMPSPQPDLEDPSPTPSGLAGAAATATETPNAPEADWRDAPIMPEISQHVLEIYQQGQAQGRDPHSFSVIGDCQSTPYVFLGPYGRGILAPASAESYLWDAINQFKPSFSRWSITSRGGFTAASLLNPLQADPHYCKPGETPLTCEFRLNNPSVAFITLETWLDPQTIDRYETYLRRILDYVISQGTIPILITKADASEIASGTHVINPAMFRVARDYDVPLVNFWRAAQYLDNYGIDPNRNGFHLSQDGYNLKNTLALRALYSVWQVVEQGSTSAALPNPTTAPTGQAAPASEAVPLVTAPDCEGGCVFFSTAASQDGAVTPQGVYAYAYGDKQLTLVLGTGFDLQDVSEDGRWLLVNNGSRLYEVNLADASAKLIDESLFTLGRQSAYWNSDDSAVVLIDRDHPFQTETGSAFNLFPSARDEELYFESGSCTSKDYCQSTGVYRLNADQSLTHLEAYSRLVFSPDGGLVAFLNPAAATTENYFHIGYLMLEEPDRGVASRRVFYFPQEHGFMIYPDVRDYAFSPDDSELFILYDVYSAYFERSMFMRTYLIDIPTGILYDLGKIDGISGSLNPRLAWSPQGDRVIFFLTNVTDDQRYSLSILETNLLSGERLTSYDQDVLTRDDYFYITNLYWR